MLRLRVLHTHRDYLAATAEATGLHVLTNVSFGGGEPESARLNLVSPNSSFRRAGASETIRFPREEAPFELLSPSVLLTASQLSDLQDNFALVHQAIGDARLGTIAVSDAAHEQILPRLQACSAEMIWIDRVLAEQSMDMTLYRSYLRHPQSIALMQRDELSVSGRQMLEEFADAVSVCSIVPELRNYLEQENVRRGELGPRGEQFREWLEGRKALYSSDGTSLEFVAYALRPLRMTGRSFQWKLNSPINADATEKERDLRRLTVDLLLRFEGQPVWCEFKAKGDTWTSSALQQILCYGSMLCSGNQLRRCRRNFSDQFQSFRPWLGVIVEERDDPLFHEDFEKTREFVRRPEVRQSLRDLSGGFVLAQVLKTGTDWTISRSEVIRW